MNFREGVACLVSKIPEGRVMTYGQVAASLGLPRAARAVGSALHHLPNPDEVPWWRVINRLGRISIRSYDHSSDYQRLLLLDEGIVPGPDGAIDLDRFRWWPSDADEADCQVTPSGLELVGEAIQERWAPRSRGRRSSPARRT
ncbi:MAG: methylated-DNA--[protein]-cysteine S-methyltransferase [Dehalococcoidia bacterium]